ncbi:MAG: hypothetical protein EHM20_17115 [Alphaproteobacteria bacterium]|nr:MAG: hypothetical protein EHM20_17115 [Alphaproteobacteria bacterium]
MKKIFLSFAILCCANRVQATPQKIEMIFLSPQKVAQLLELIEKNKAGKITGHLAASDQTSEGCFPMGDGCFHPQFGYMDKKPDAATVKTPAIVVPKDPELELKTFNAVETNMISCDKGNYFDIFCGKTKANEKPAEVEIWFDIYSSLRTVDYNKDPDHCNRRTFMSRVVEACKGNVDIPVYNTALKQVGVSSCVCMAYGTNDESKLLKWMKASSAKKLLIVTDIDEVSRGMRDFLEENAAKIIGDGVTPFSSTDLVNYANDFAKACKK